MQARSSAVATLIAALALTLCAPCQAQEEGAPSGSDEPSSEARAAFDRAMVLYEQRAYARAEQEFRRSWELMADHPRRSLVLVNIARCVEAQPGREREALGIYRQVLEEIGTSGSDDSMIHEGQQRARDRIAELEARLAALGTTEPAQSTAEGAISPVGPVVLGAAGLLLIGGIVTGALTLSETDSLSAMCPGDVCPASARARHSTVETLSITTDVLMAAAAAAAIAGVVLTLVLRDAAPVDASAICTQDGCLATLGGRL